MTTILMLAAAMMTPWGEKVTSENCWREYPRPQMVRANWTCLNGDWDYAITSVTNTPASPWSPEGRGPVLARGRIRVPYPIESALSGVGRLLKPDEFLWYRRTIDCAPKKGERVLLHFDGVDFRAMVFIGHREVMDVPHAGAQEPFTLDITDYLGEGKSKSEEVKSAELTVCVWDPTEDFVGSRGKQCREPHGCFYTRSSGIWQSVWLETVPETYIADYNVIPDIDRGEVSFEVKVEGQGQQRTDISIFGADGNKIGKFLRTPTPNTYTYSLPTPHLWSPEDPFLYSFKATCGADAVTGYFAMRKFAKGKDAKGVLRFFLNNKPYYIMGTLDQGWWPDGLLTPPSEEAMVHDIRTLKDCGFNMMRKHIKVEPRRYYALCDRMGLLVLQDLPCAADLTEHIARGPYDPKTVFCYGFQRHELKAMIDNLRKTPSIVMWVPYNEGWSQPCGFLTHATLDFVRRYDPTRLVNGPSGYCDFEGGSPDPLNGSYDCPWPWAHRPAEVCEAGDTVDMHAYRGPGMPTVNDRRISFLGEFGGLGHPVSNHLWKVSNSWGYGGIDDTKTREGLEKTYRGLMEKLAVLAGKGLAGSVYTQTTDVEIEINGLMTYDRKVLKFDPAFLREVHRGVREAFAAAVEKKRVPDLTVEPGGLSAAEAVARVRALRAKGDVAPKTIAVKGANRLTETLVFTEADRDLSFVGEGGASFSGGIEIAGWREAEPGVWEAAAPKTAKGETMFFDQLWVNGRRAPCARLPNEGWLDISAASQAVAQVGAGFTNYLNRVTFATNDVAVKALAGVPAADLPYLEVGVINKWAYNLLALGGYAAERNEMTVPSPFDWKSWKHWMRGSSLVAFFNVRTAFDAPGEWFLDVSAGKVRYRPLPGERVPELKFVAPRAGLSRLVDFRGDWRKGRCARNVSFDSIAFEHTSAPMTANRPGLVDQLQAASTFDGAVTAEGVRNVSFTRCRIAHTGNYAMRFNSSCVSNTVADCTLEDLGAGGVWMGASYRFGEKKAEIPRKVLPPTRADATAFNLISNCTIRAGGRYNPEGTGVALTHCSDTRVVHCDISDMMYTGVSVGWTWGFSGSVAQRNEIAYNRIWDLGKGVMSDMGGVYMLGTSFGSRVHDNVIHGVRSHSYGGWGLYADEGSEGIVFERNLVWDTTDGGFHQHYGTGCIVRNNIFAWNRKLGAVRMYRSEVQGIPCTLHFYNNVIVVREGPLCGVGVRKVGGVWANNLWWDVRGEGTATFDGLAWSDWKASGKETCGVFADPCFVDPEVGDGRLRADSPAFALGFKPFDSSRAGRK